MYSADLRKTAALSGLILFATVFWSVTRFSGDEVLLPIVSILAFVGFIVLVRLQPDLTRLDDRLVGLDTRQAIYISAGIVLMVGIGRFFNYWHLLKRYRYTMLLGCIGLLLVTFFFGTPIGGAKLWIVSPNFSEIIK